MWSAVGRGIGAVGHEAELADGVKRCQSEVVEHASRVKQSTVEGNSLPVSSYRPQR